MRKIRYITLMLLCLCLFIGSAADLIPRAYAASEMAVSDSCVDFIKRVEGFSAKPYSDYSQYTVGYGTKCPDNKFNDYSANGISKEEAEALLQDELAKISEAIHQKLINKHNLALTQYQFDALVSFSFNIGTNWMTYNSTLRHAILNHANEDEMVYAFGLYCTAGGQYLPGLVTRRLCEANMFLNGVYSQTRNSDYGYVYYDAASGTVTYRVQAFVCSNNTAPALDATRNGDPFLGWYTDLTGGTKVNTLNSSLIGKTLFARWESSENTEDQDSVSTTVKVTGDVVNVRSGPGTNYGLVKQVRQNTVLTVSHVTHLTNMKWGKVQGGWICLDYTNYDAVVNGTDDPDVENNKTPSGDAAVPDNDADQDNQHTDENTSSGTGEIVSGVVKVNDFLRVRSGPGTTYSTVGFLFNGNRIKILEQKQTGSMVWGRFEDGWVSMNYITTDNSGSNETANSGSAQDPEPESKDPVNKTESVSIKGNITADALRIRSGPGTTNPIVGLYLQNDTVVISEKVLVGVTYWGKTNKGWISMDYVLSDTSGTETEKTAENSAKTVHADCLRIRKDAGTNHKIVGFLYDGDIVTVLETKSAGGTVWGRIDKGWICMEYVK